MENGHKYFFGQWPEMPWKALDKIKKCGRLEHELEVVWLTDDLEGFRCKKCGIEILETEWLDEYPERYNG